MAACTMAGGRYYPAEVNGPNYPLLWLVAAASLAGAARGVTLGWQQPRSLGSHPRALQSIRTYVVVLGLSSHLGPM